jgi:hypothetical protein
LIYVVRVWTHRTLHNIQSKNLAKEIPHINNVRHGTALKWLKVLWNILRVPKDCMDDVVDNFVGQLKSQQGFPFSNGIATNSECVLYRVIDDLARMDENSWAEKVNGDMIQEEEKELRQESLKLLALHEKFKQRTDSQNLPFFLQPKFRPAVRDETGRACLGSTLFLWDETPPPVTAQATSNKQRLMVTQPKLL